MAESGAEHETHESNQSLYMLTAAPLIWALHFLASYVTAAIWCARFAGPDESLLPVRIAIGIYTAIALIGIGIAGWKGCRRHLFGGATLPHDFDSPQDRHRFLGFATLLLAVMSAVATLFVALAAVFIGSCH